MTYKLLTSQGGRENNEDSADCIESGGNLCFVVADGLGGHGKGEVASQKAVEVFRREFEAATASGTADNESFLKAAFQKSQDEILILQAEQNAKLGMKTTAVCLSIIAGKCMWGHIGDSRLYLFVKNKVKERTLDHSVPQMLALSREIKEKHIAKHPDRNRLLRVMGIEWDSPKYELSDEVDLDDPNAVQAFLLCTDGFWELVDSKKMGAFLKKSKTADEWLALMEAEVRKNGSGTDMDNYTAIGIVF
jgi:serine/threonine protein phosphatase PrpC